MTNIIRQLITLYPTDTLVVSLISGTNISGRPAGLIIGPNTNPDAGVFQLKNSSGAITNSISICHIASIAITSATYNNTITYLPTPTPEPTGCSSNCEKALRSLLSVGKTGVRLKAGGQTVAQGKVLKSEYGMVVITSLDNKSPAFVSLCELENIDSTTE